MCSSLWGLCSPRAKPSVPYPMQAQGQSNCELAVMSWALIALAPPHIVLSRNKRPHLEMLER